MKVCVVAGTFRQGWGYQENVWAEQLALLGHSVRVLNTAATTSSPEVISFNAASYEVQGLATRILPHCILLTRDLADAVLEFRPDLLVWVAVSQHFGRAIVNDPRLAAIPVITLFSENVGIHEYNWLKPGLPLGQRVHALGYRLLRRGIIRKSLRRSVVIVGNWGGTRDILLDMMPRPERDEVNRKIIDYPLGFNPEVYGYDPEVGRRVRETLGFSDEDIVICASSRFEPDKEPVLEAVIGGIRRATAADPAVKCLLVGLSDGKTSDHFRAQIAADPNGGRFVCHPFASQDRLNELYNASDMVVFGNTTVSCAAALATGLFACLSDNGAMAPMLRAEEQGLFFRPYQPQDLAAKLGQGAAILRKSRGPDRAAFRRRLADGARWLGYDRLVSTVLAKYAEGAKP